MQNIAEIMSDYNEVRRQEVYVHTWGHLAIKKNKAHEIKILFSDSSYNHQGVSLIDTKLGHDLNDSPWLYEAILNRINKAIKRKPGVYLIDGIIKNYRIIGKTKLVVKL